MQENVGIMIQSSMKFVAKGHIVNKSSWVQEMAWHQTGD